MGRGYHNFYPESLVKSYQRYKGIIPPAMIRHRYRRIVGFFARLLIGFALWDLFLPRIGLRLWSRRTRPQRLRRSAQAYRALAVQMGGVLIKVGQFLSSRVDILPDEVTRELEGLQDEVPPERFEDIRRVAEAEYKAPLSEKFADFEEAPLAAASLGQVHRARLRRMDEIDTPASEDDGFDVVVKVQRPDIETIIATDLAALRTVGAWLKRYRPISRRVDIPRLLEEFSRVLYEEIDYLAEGRNAETFAANFQDDPRVRVPAVIWTHTTRRALTLENVLAIKITDYDAITASGVDRTQVATRLLDIYLRQIFEDGFFHADPHPGNLFVSPLREPAGSSDEENLTWQLTFVDFGMVGHLPAHMMSGLRELLIGVGTQDAARVVKAYQMLDVLLPSADLKLLEKMEAKAFEQFWGKSMSELTRISTREMTEFASEFREILYSMPFQVPQDFIFLARCVGILSGMCTGLDPEFNVWNSLAPYAQKLITQEARTGAEFWIGEAKSRIGAMLSMPLRLDALMAHIERGDLAVRAPEVNQRIVGLERAIRRLADTVIFAALLIGGLQLYLDGQIVLGQVLLGGAFLSFLWIFLFGRRR